MTDHSDRGPDAGPLDVLVVGAGFAGLYMLHRLRTCGFQARVLEAGAGIGGTWYWNRYPGARCDIESLEYSYQFSEDLEQAWTWSERYAGQPEILRYLEHVADRFDLRKDVQLNSRVRAAWFDEDDALWRVRLEGGAILASRYLVMATGCLSRPNIPAIPGLDSFTGPVLHTGLWPERSPEFAGRRVAVIGTGSSAIQSIPVIAEQAAQVYVFQRTAAYVVPARNAAMDPDHQRRIKQNYRAYRRQALAQPAAAHFDISESRASDCDGEGRRARFQERWERGGLPFLGAFADLMTDRGANESAAEFLREKVRQTVEDPTTAALLSPRHTFGCKRLCVDTGYYESFNRANVTLVDARRDPIQAADATGLRTAQARYEVDLIVLATGFDAMTGALRAIDIVGRGGRSLSQAWASGPQAYLGLSVAGFPNLFTITGPGSPSVLANMVPAIEQHVEWIADCLVRMRADGLDAIEATDTAQTAWARHVGGLAEATLYSTCDSWYVGANIPGKSRVFMPYLGFPDYVARCRQVAERGYPGFERSDASARAADFAAIPYG